MQEYGRLKSVAPETRVVRRSLTGVPYELVFSASVRLGHYSHAFWRFGDQTIKVRSADEETMVTTAVHILGADLEAEYTVGGGTLHVGQYSVWTDDRETLLGRPGIAVWLQSGLSVAFQVDSGSTDLLIEAAIEFEAAVEDESVISLGVAPAMSYEGDDLFLTVDKIGVVDISPKEGWADPEGPGRTVSAGMLYESYRPDDKSTTAILVTETVVAEIASDFILPNRPDLNVGVVEIISQLNRTGGRAQAGG